MQYICTSEVLHRVHWCFTLTGFSLVRNQSQVTLLSPNQRVLYTWDEPSAERTIMWNVYGRKKPSYPAFINKVSLVSSVLGFQRIMFCPSHYLLLQRCKLFSMCWNSSAGPIDFGQLPAKRHFLVVFSISKIFFTHLLRLISISKFDLVTRKQWDRLG